MVKMAIIPVVFVQFALMLRGNVSSSHVGTVLLVLHVEQGNCSPPSNLVYFLDLETALSGPCDKLRLANWG
jgi:hypothetical protein